MKDRNQNARKRIVLAQYILSALLLTSQANAQTRQVASSKPVDITQFEVAEVHLGMSVKQVIAALKKHFNAADSQIKTVTLPAVLLASNQYVASVSYSENGQEIVHVSFTIKVPAGNSEPEAASSIQYSLNDAEANRKQMLQSAITKYGAPTAYDNTIDTYQWCAYKPGPRWPGGPLACDMLNKSHLKLYRASLTLADPTYAVKLAEEVTRRQTQTPKF
jgi:hypothetical protein